MTACPPWRPRTRRPGRSRIDHRQRPGLRLGCRADHQGREDRLVRTVTAGPSRPGVTRLQWPAGYGPRPLTKVGRGRALDSPVRPAPRRFHHDGTAPLLLAQSDETLQLLRTQAPRVAVVPDDLGHAPIQDEG